MGDSDQEENFTFTFVKGHAPLEDSDDEGTTTIRPAFVPPPPPTGKKNKKGNNVNFPEPEKLCTYIPGDTVVEPEVDYVLFQALYDYNSADPDDLAFKANDIIRVTDEGDSPQSWFYGADQDGREGHFPGTYVRKIPMGNSKIVIDPESGVVEKTQEKAIAVPVPVQQPATVGKSVTAKGEPYVLYQALYDYKSQDPDDLTFLQNDILRVTDEGDGPNSWFYGETQEGAEGNFPGTYVRKINLPGSAKPKIVGGLEHLG